jgi:hypothetical protein
MNRDKFFKLVRQQVFGGKLKQDQVDGMDQILRYWELHCQGWDLRWLAYMLATVYWETAHTMQPVTEYGGEKYLKSKKYWPYIGRGLVQLTWEDNYRKMAKLTGAIGMVEDPGLALLWPLALAIMVEGMTDGASKQPDFTKYGLENFFNETNEDPVGARKIINGTDKAKEIAAIYQKFAAAILSAVS